MIHRIIIHGALCVCVECSYRAVLCRDGRLLITSPGDRQATHSGSFVQPPHAAILPPRALAWLLSVEW